MRLVEIPIVVDKDKLSNLLKLLRANYGVYLDDSGVYLQERTWK